MPRSSWTDQEEEFLRENYLEMELVAIAEQLGRSRFAVKSRARILGLRKRERLTLMEKEQIRGMFPTMATRELAEKIGRSEATIINFASRVGLRKDPDYLKTCLEECGRNLHESGKSHRFPKGHTPANKGLRRPGWSAGRMKETQFKKGKKPHTWKPGVGHERVNVDGYIEVKVRDDHHHKNYKLKHRVVWEKHNGTIPKGHAVVFKDGNKLNCSIENLEIITRADLMKRNTIHNYPEPVKSMIHQLAGFKRKLNRYAKKQNRGSAEHAVRDDGEASR